MDALLICSMCGNLLHIHKKDWFYRHPCNKPAENGKHPTVVPSDCCSHRQCACSQNPFYRTSHGDVTKTPKDYSHSSFLHGYTSLCHVVFAIRDSHKLSWGGSQECSVCLRLYSPRDEYLTGYGNIGIGYPSRWRHSLVASLECWANPRKVHCKIMYFSFPKKYEMYI